MSGVIVAAYPLLGARLAAERAAGRTLALANGCFDLLHVGHVRLLVEARGLADLLVVALNGDASARRLKGAGRPFVPLAERMEIVAALAGVDYVTSFDEDTGDALVRALRPSVLVKGTDREAASVPERETLASVGGRIAICGDPKSHASSDLVARLRER